MHAAIKLVCTLLAIAIQVHALEQASSKSLYSYVLNSGSRGDQDGDYKSLSSVFSPHEAQKQAPAHYYIKEEPSTYIPHGGKLASSSNLNGNQYKYKYGPSDSGSSYKKPFIKNKKTSIVYGRRFAERLGLL